MNRKPCDLLITASETNSHHGVGIFLQRLFPNSTDFVCLRTTSLYNGEEPFGSAHHELCSRYLPLKETEEHVRRILALYDIRRILCVPYYREEFIHAILAKRITGATLCTFLMDDQNIFTSKVPDHWVSDLLEVSDLCLGISPEMCSAYQRKFGRDVYLLPPVLKKTEPLVPCYWQREPDEPLRAAMIGNVWTARRFDQLREWLRSTGLQLDWYGNGPKATWLPGTPEEWESDHIRCMGFLPEEDLVASLASYPFVLIPSGSLDAEDDNPAFSRLSLPSRLLFLHAHTDTPAMILGNAETAAGHFVTRLQTGVCTSAAPVDFQSQLARLLDPTIRQSFRSNIRRLAPSLILAQGGEWLWESLAAGKPAPADFHRIFSADYLPTNFGLEASQATRPRPQWIFPEPGEAFRDAHAASFGFIRTRHLPVLAAFGLTLPASAEIELSILNSAVAHYVLSGSVPAGGDILFIGTDIPPLLSSLPSAFRLWRIADLSAWQQAGYAGQPSHVVDAQTGDAYPSSFPQFAAIVSTSWCGQLGSDPHHHEGLSLYLEACTQPGGSNVHLFFATLHPSYFWVGPAHTYLHRRFLGAADWPDRDELLAADDLFTMSERSYHQHWKPSVGKSYTDFGRPISFALYWRNAASH